MYVWFFLIAMRKTSEEACITYKYNFNLLQVEQISKGKKLKMSYKI